MSSKIYQEQYLSVLIGLKGFKSQMTPQRQPKKE